MGVSSGGREWGRGRGGVGVGVGVQKGAKRALAWSHVQPPDPLDSALGRRAQSLAFASRAPQSIHQARQRALSLHAVLDADPSRSIAVLWLIAALVLGAPSLEQLLLCSLSS